MGFEDVALLGNGIGLGREEAEVLRSRAPRGVRDRWLGFQQPPCCLGFAPPRWLPWDIVGRVALVLLHSFEGEDLGVGDGEGADEDGLVELAFLGDRDLPCRATVEPRPSKLFWF